MEQDRVLETPARLLRGRLDEALLKELLQNTDFRVQDITLWLVVTLTMDTQDALRSNTRLRLTQKESRQKRARSSVRRAFHVPPPHRRRRRLSRSL